MKTEDNPIILGWEEKVVGFVLANITFFVLSPSRANTFCSKFRLFFIIAIIFIYNHPCYLK